jgi:TATA-box binding protein (TBP) (component of TFIID and TFIIIB)
MDIDQEWENFISSNYDGDLSTDNKNIDENNSEYDDEEISADILLDLTSESPKCSNIYISTKTKIAYLNVEVDLKDLFWKINVMPYSKPENGVIKKQIKFNSTEPEEVKIINDKLRDVPYYEEHIITHIDNPSGRIKYKDIRKISIGISRKDIMSYRCKKKSAFYNCFVLIYRLKVDGTFKEFHVKVFNTGKLEIPGVQNDESYRVILQEIINILQPYFEETLFYKENINETVLINSDFNCGFFINREALYDILRNKYNIQSIYDPCSYPGIQCKFYYNPDIGIQNGCQISEENEHLYNNIIKVSFMIFRTGSVLIVGKCDENILMIIYNYLKHLLSNEYKFICQNNKLLENDTYSASKDKKKKIRRKNITIEIQSSP